MQTIKLADGLSRGVEWCGLLPGMLSISLTSPGDLAGEAALFSDPERTRRIEYDFGAEDGPTIYEGYTELVLVKRTGETMLIQLIQREE